METASCSQRTAAPRTCVPEKRGPWSRESGSIIIVIIISVIMINVLLHVAETAKKDASGSRGQAGRQLWVGELGRGAAHPWERS